MRQEGTRGKGFKEVGAYLSKADGGKWMEDGEMSD